MSQTARGCVFFYGHRKGEHAAFSQFYGPIEFADEDGNTYNCAEQYMMAAKARVMGDTKTLAQILACDYNPTAIKQMGRRVSPYSEEKWVAARTRSAAWRLSRTSRGAGARTSASACLATARTCSLTRAQI